jgi:hypothetical protein
VPIITLLIGQLQELAGTQLKLFAGVHVHVVKFALLLEDPVTQAVHVFDPIIPVKKFVAGQLHTFNVGTCVYVEKAEGHVQLVALIGEVPPVTHVIHTAALMYELIGQLHTFGAAHV